MKTILLGANNPISADPQYALYPHPKGSTGHRLSEMLDAAYGRKYTGVVGRKQYAEGFERRNLLDSKKWSKKAAKEAAPAILSALGGRRVIIVGAETCDALGLPRSGWCEWVGAWTGTGEMQYCVIPHASGRCREYNDPAMVARVGDILLAEYLRGLRK